MTPSPSPHAETLAELLARALPQPDSDNALREYANGRPKGLAPWRPSGASLAILDDVLAILAEDRDYWPLTNRLILYRLIGTRPQLYAKAKHHRPSCDKRGCNCDPHHNEKAIEYVVDRGRRAGFIPWQAIDDGRSDSSLPFDFDDEVAFWRWVQDKAANAQLPRQRGQALYLELFCESGGSIPFLSRLAHRYGVPVFSSSGTNTTTSRFYAAARAVARYQADVDAGRAPRRTALLHVGDCDLKGIELFNTLRLDTAAFVADMGYPGIIATHRVGLLPSQTADLETEPLTSKDRDAGLRVRAQLEALGPRGIADIVEQAIAALIDQDTLEAVKRNEDPWRERITDRTDAIIDELD